MNDRKITNALSVGIFLLGLFSSRAVPWVQGAILETSFKAQDVNNDWATPANLSRSGASTAPQMVLDNAGTFHVLWEDEIDGFVYSRGGPDGWSTPQSVELPFFTRRSFPELQEQAATPRFTPHLVADQRGSIHAFWVDKVTDEDGVLYHSSVPAGSFSQYDAWSVPQPLETGALGPTAVVSGAGLHLIYVRRLDTSERPSGIYYQRMSLDSGNWSNRQGLYQSRYLRSLADDNLNLSLTALTDGRLLAAWDDSGREISFVSQSQDGGGSWEAPLEIDRRLTTDSIDAAGPGGITVGGLGSQAVLTWRAGHESGSPCTQYYRTQADGDAAWSNPQIVPGQIDCLSSIQFINDETILYLFGTVEQPGSGSGSSTSMTYLLAWDGNRWSDLQLQSELAELRNPETNQLVTLACLSAEGRLNQLSVAGCDRGVGGDIWWTTRSLGDSAAWFPPPSAWQGPETIATTQHPIAGAQLIIDGTGASHAIWFEAGQPQIFHSRWDGTAWSSAAAVITAGSEAVEELAVSGNGNRLFLVYRDNQGLHFSQADAQRPTEWSTSVPLSAGQPDGQYPSILMSQSGELLVNFSISLNEPRGVYLVRSADLGASWSEAAQIFSGSAAGWTAVGQSQLTETTDGRLHALLSQISLPPENTRLEMAYSQSIDRGLTWSALNPVIATPTIWTSLVGFGERTVHLIWAEAANERMVLWHSQSADSGGTWTERAQVGSLDLNDMPAGTLDPAGQYHLLGVDNDRLLSWTFGGAGWQAAESFVANLGDGGILTAIVDTAGRLVAVYGSTVPEGSEGAASSAVLGMIRSLDLPAEALPTPPPPPPTATPEPTIAPTRTPEPTPTVALPAGANAGPLSGVPGANSRMGQLAIAAIPAGLVVLLVMFLALRALRKRG